MEEMTLSKKSIFTMGILLLIGSSFLFFISAVNAEVSDDASYLILKEDGKDGDDKDKGDKEKIEVPEDWVDDYSLTDEYNQLFSKLKNAETCFELMQIRMGIFAAETRWWRAKAVPDSDGATRMAQALIHLMKLRLEVAKNRTKLEQIEGTYEECVESKKLADLEETYADLKMKMKEAAFSIDSGEDFVPNMGDAKGRCAKSLNMFNRYKKKLKKFNEKFKEEVEAGEIEDISNATEISLILEEIFYQAVTLHELSLDENDPYKKMKYCTGVIDETNAGNTLITKAKRFKNGKNKDESSDIENLEARAKMLLNVMADKYAESLNYSNKEDLRELLDEAELQVLEVLKEIASVKYEKQKDIDEEYLLDISITLDDIKDKIKEAVDKMDEGDEDELSNKEKKAKINKLNKKTRIEIKALNKKVEKKEEKAEGDAEENMVRFVDQSSINDVQTAKKASKAYKTKNDYDEGLKSAYTAKKTVDIAKKILKEIN